MYRFPKKPAIGKLILLKGYVIQSATKYIHFLYILKYILVLYFKFKKPQNKLPKKFIVLRYKWNCVVHAKHN